MKYRAALNFIILLNACFTPLLLKAQESIQGPLSVHTTLNQINPDFGQALSIHDNNLSGDTRFLSIGRFSNKPFIRHLGSDRILFMNQNGTYINAEIADDGTIYPRYGVIANYLIEKAGHWDAATAAEIQTTGGDITDGGPQTKTFYGGWRATALGQSITLDLRASVSVSYISFGTFYALDSRYIPAGYTVSYSNDNVSYTTLATATGNSDLNPIHNAGGLYARYWRITVTAFQSSETSASINGLKILSTTGASSNGNYWGNKHGSSDISFNGGGVSIGTNKLPSGYRLAVNGAIISTKVKVLTYPNWPDYVFDTSYTLKPLKELSTYINDNKHLPGIPSAEEVRKDGIDLADNQAALLKKIEELTLYLIEQNNQIGEMKKEIEALKKKQH